MGSGALGSSLGSVLTEYGSEVWFIDQWKEHIDAMKTRGLLIRENSADKAVKVRATTDPAEAGEADLVILLVKSFSTRDAIRKASPLIGEKTVVLTLQNGLGNEEILAEELGKERVISGRTYAGGVLLAPGHIIVGTKGKYTYIGEMDGKKSDRISSIADEFNKAGLLTVVSDNIVGMIWDKLFINAATGALSGITKLPYGGLYAVPEVKECALEAIAEGITVARSLGIKISGNSPETIWYKAAEGLPPEFKASILQSLEKNQQTEIDFINGAIVRWGEKCGIPTPVNKSLVAGIKGVEYRINYKG